MKPIVAIVGRPNVGKSTFFNCVTKSKDALVDNFPGVTRDRKYGDAVWNDVEFILVDTGGFISDDNDDFAHHIQFQVQMAIENADVIVFIMDGKSGISPFDKDVLEVLRKIKKPVLYVINKIDGVEKEVNLYDFYSLGIEKLYPVSAEHRYGIYDFLDDLILFLPKLSSEKIPGMISLAVVGRPNVGKSSLINRILGEERLVVSDIPGTTRDSIDSICHIDNNPYLLIDTAGIRRKGKVKKKIEKFSIIKALRSLERCDVALIVIDVNEGVTDQDISIAGYAYEKGCGCIFLLNKWDLVEKDLNTAKMYYEKVRMEAKFLNFAPMMTISALTGTRVLKIFKFVNNVYSQYSLRIGTGQLNKIFKDAVEKNEPSLYKGKRIKFYYATQITSKPPTFVCFVNYPENIHFSYKRYLINQIREKAGLDKTPIRIYFRQRSLRKKYVTKKKVTYDNIHKHSKAKRKR